MNKKHLYFDIKYIFIFDYRSNLEEEIKNIEIYDIKEYINKNTVFNEANEKDLISPNFSNNDIVGHCIKYNSNNDYTKCINYKKNNEK